MQTVRLSVVLSMQQGVLSMSSSFPRPLTEQEEQFYVEKLQQGDANARSVLIERNLRLVAHIAKKYISPGTCQDDLISIGTIGLIKAVSTYTAGRSTRLATYAAKCIENAILSQMRLWLRTNPPRAEKNQNGVFLQRLPRTFTSFFAPLRTAM
mgnify:FL=1